MDFDLNAFPSGGRHFTGLHIAARTVKPRRFTFSMPSAARASAVVVMMIAIVAVQVVGSEPPAAKNTWRGITPLRSSSVDVARILDIDLDSPDGMLSGPFAVEGGEVTFSYLTPSLAKIYRAPRSMVGKVFTIYFQPSDSMPRDAIKFTREFKQCTENMSKEYYYLVSDAGLAYQFERNTNLLDTIIYQPSRAEIRRLAVNSECVF